jgi:hypothetical protein
MDFAKLVESVSDAFSCDWDVGTDQNERLSSELTAIVPAISSVSRTAQVAILSHYIEDRMSLDCSEETFERIREIVSTAISGE